MRPLIVFVALALVACAPLRAVTYPPSFHYVPRSDLRSTMWELAADVVELGRMLDQTTTLIVEADVVQRLALMESHAAKLDGTRTNHPKIDQNLAAFRRAIVAAKAASEASPPNYFLAGHLTGSCTSCHESR
jgi:hypothetical protein